MNQVPVVWEKAYIEGYFPLALDVVKQVVHDGKKSHVLVSVNM
jgi:hypothetical protein